MAAFAMTEPDAGSDVAAMRTIARRDGTGWILDGEKHLISNAGLADIYVVFAVTSPGDGSRPRWSSTMTSVNVAFCMSAVTACPRIQMFVASEVAIALRHGSIGTVIIPAGFPAGGCYGNTTVTP